MPREQNPNIKKAEKLYKVEGRTLKDIADRLHIPEGTVRSWKNRYNWDTSGRSDLIKKNATNVAKKSQKNATLQSPNATQRKRGRPRKGEEKLNQEPPKRKRGGQPGNMNAVGHTEGGGPVGNHYALKHGAYSIAKWGVLDDEEQEFLETIPDEVEDLLIQDIQLYTVRERRIMKALNKAYDAKGGIYLYSTQQSETKRRFKSDEERERYEEAIAKKVEDGDRLPGDSYTVTTTTASTQDLITRLERELSTVQRNRTQAEQALAQYRADRSKDENSGSEGDTKTWVEAVLRARQHQEEKT